MGLLNNKKASIIRAFNPENKEEKNPKPTTDGTSNNNEIKKEEPKVKKERESDKFKYIVREEGPMDRWHPADYNTFSMYKGSKQKFTNEEWEKEYKNHPKIVKTRNQQ